MKNFIEFLACVLLVTFFIRCFIFILIIKITVSLIVIGLKKNSYFINSIKHSDSSISQSHSKL